MVKICIIIPSYLPVPALLGGAIETLATILLDQNETKKRVKFIVVTSWVSGIEKYTEKYQYSEFHFIKTPLVFRKVINAFNFFYGKLSGEYDYLKSYFHYKTKMLMQTIDADYVVVEHGIYKHFGFLREKYDRDNLFLHIHGVGSLPDKETQETFGNIIGVSNYVSGLWRSNYIKANTTKFITCYNGVNTSNFNISISAEERENYRKKYNVSNQDVLIIYCGRITEIKGVRELVQSVLELKENVKLMIVGSPNFKDKANSGYLNQITKLCKKSSKIFFTDFIENSKLYKYYQMADMQVVPSLCEEGASLVTVEGMMSGLPLIVTNSGGLIEYSNDKCAICIDKRDALNNLHDRDQFIQDLKDAIQNLACDKEKRLKMGRAAKQHSISYTEIFYYNNFLSAFRMP